MPALRIRIAAPERIWIAAVGLQYVSADRIGRHDSAATPLLSHAGTRSLFHAAQAAAREGISEEWRPPQPALRRSGLVRRDQPRSLRQALDRTSAYRRPAHAGRYPGRSPGASGTDDRQAAEV